jgi:hypothetical protein
MIKYHKDTSQMDEGDPNFQGTEKQTLSLMSRVHSKSNRMTLNSARGLRPLSISFSCMLMCFALIMEQYLCSAFASSFFLEGIGYREQALQ